MSRAVTCLRASYYRTVKQLFLYQRDAFTREPFRGNAAAYVPLETWLDDATMQAIAGENNLSETAFTVRAADHDGRPSYHLRWFTPSAEIALCGHATLATAGQLFDDVHPAASGLAFNTLSGWLLVDRGEEERLVLDFPAQMPTRVDVPDDIGAILGATPIAAWSGIDDLYVFDHEADVRDMVPDMGALARREGRGVIVTAPADEPGIDFVSRFFAPKVGVPEDPVTGSAHTKLVPYWSARLNRRVLRARQISARVGDLWCELVGDRVKIGGHTVRVLEGTIFVP